MDFTVQAGFTDGRPLGVPIVGDEAIFSRSLEQEIVRRGGVVSRVATGAVAARLARNMRPDVMLLQDALPDASGLEICRNVRLCDSDVVIVMVATRAAEEEKIRGFEAGADDYVIWPLPAEELLARMYAKLRRYRRRDRPEKVIEVGDLCVNLEDRTARVGGHALPLRRKEFDILAVLAAAPGVVKSREELVRETGVARVPTVP